jgi:hypothetical protein
MSILIPITLFGWIPFILLLFSLVPPRRAVILSFIIAWLFLPYAGYALPGVPDYTKRSATVMGVLLATVIFRSDWLFSLRPRWYDLPMATWSLCPIASSLANGLGLYDGISASFEYCVTWGLPYLIGRVYFTRLEHLRALAMGILEGGMAYVPLCLFEIRMSPHLHRMVYGFEPSGWGEVVLGGYRPKVFMSLALEVAMWMTVASTTGFWLWASGAVKELRGFALKYLLIPLIITTVLCKVAGGWLLLIMGISTWYLIKWSKSRLPVLVLVLVPSLYLLTRSTGLWSGQEAIDLVRSVLNERRAESLQVRISSENLLVAKALERPVFGWGGWSRSRIIDADGRDRSITDGLWVIAVGTNGLVGLISLYSSLLLPMVLLVGRCPARALLSPALAPACVLATILNLYAIDCIANAMVNPIYPLALGGVVGVLGRLNRDVTQSRRPSSGPERAGHLNKLNIYNKKELFTNITVSGTDPREEAAIRLGLLGRSLMEHGMSREAEEARSSALQRWAELAADYPDDLEYRKGWLDGLNDSAWTLLTSPGLEGRDVSRAVQIAEQAVGLEPEGAAYWNTLGIAYFRVGDWKAAIRALERSMELSAGGTSFDYFFLAMACWKRGDKEEARHWYSRANKWMEEHNPDHGELLHFRREAKALVDSHRA